MSSDYVPSVLRQNWQVLWVENLQGQRKSYLGFPFIDATSPYTQGLLQPVEYVCSWWCLFCISLPWDAEDMSGTFPAWPLSVCLFWPHKLEGRLNWEKEHIPNRWPPGPKDWKSKSEMSPRLTFFGLICHGNMILLTIFRGNWSNLFTFIALVIKPYWGFILFCILAFFPLSSCSVLNVGSSKGISKVGKIWRNLQNNWIN